MFDETLGKVSSFITTCKLYIRMKIRGVVVKEQIQWILLYVQGGSADIWKENTLKDLEGRLLEYKTAGKFLVDIKKEFGGGDKETVKVTKLKKIEQGGRTMEEFVQEFQKTARGSGYEEKLLVEEFKQGINGTICQKLIESEYKN